MSDVDQFKQAVTEAGAEEISIEQGPRKGEERLVIKTPGGLVTIGVPLKGKLDEDIKSVTAAAEQIVARAKRLTAEPARNLAMPLPLRQKAATEKR
jgi:hypothetical protein